MSEFKFAEILKGLLAEYKISGADLGRAIGVSKETISQYCKGEIIPRADKIMKMADFFDVSPEYLLTGIEPEDKKEHQDLGLSGEAIRLLKQGRYIHDERVFDFVNSILSDPEFYRRIFCCFNSLNIFNADIDGVAYQKLVFEALIENNNGDRQKAADDFLSYMGDMYIQTYLNSYIREVMLKKSGVSEVIDALKKI